MQWNKIQAIPSDFGTVTCIAISPNNFTLAASTDNGMILLYDLNKNETMFSKSVHSKAINQIVWSNNGNYLISCSCENNIKLLNSENLEEMNDSYEGYDSSITCCDISPSCELIVGADDEGRILLWPTSSPDECTSDDGHTDAITSVHFFSSLFILTSSLDGIVRMFSTEKLILLKSYSESIPVSSACFSPDRRYITFSLLQSITYIVDVATGEYVGEFKNYINNKYLLTPCFSYDRSIPDGPVQFIIPSEDGRLISYDFETQDTVWEFKPHDGYFKWDISRNGIFIATSDIESQEIIIWKQ